MPPAYAGVIAPYVLMRKRNVAGTDRPIVALGWGFIRAAIFPACDEAPRDAKLSEPDALTCYRFIRDGLTPPVGNSDRAGCRRLRFMVLNG